MRPQRALTAARELVGECAAAGDAVQETLIAAAAQGPRDRLPDNRRGWLYHVATRRMVDQIRSDLARRAREDAVAAQWSAEWALPTTSSR